MTDPVNHPQHYNAHPSGVEAVELCEWIGFSLGNALEYAWRAGLKGSRRQDLEKSLWYVRRTRETPGHRLGLPARLVERARQVVNAEPRGSLLAVLIHQLALPAIIRDEHLENAEYALVQEIEKILVHRHIVEKQDQFNMKVRAECNAELMGAETTCDDEKVTCPNCKKLYAELCAKEEARP